MNVRRLVVTLLLLPALLAPPLAPPSPPAVAQGGPSQNVSLWAPTGGPLVKRQAGMFVVVRPDDGNRLAVGAGAFVYRSDDGGATWDSTYLMDVSRRSQEEDARPQIIQFAADPGGYDRLYAVVKLSRGNQQTFEVWRSEDNGRTWPKASDVPPVPGTAPQLAVASDGSVYLAMESRVYRSSDRGAAWAEVTGDLNTTQRITALAIHPADPKTVLVGFDRSYYTDTDVSVARTDDGGRTWRSTSISLGKPPAAGGNVVSAAFSPVDPNRIWLTHSRHGFVTSPDGGRTWSRWDEGVEQVVYGSGLHNVVPDPRDSETAWALGGGRSRNGATVYRTTDGGRSWTLQTNGVERPSNGGIDFDAVAFGGGRLFLASQASLFRSDDRGGSWAPTYDWTVVGANPRALVAPARSRILYVVTADSLLRSGDGGASWQTVGRLPSQSSTFELAVDGADPDTLYFFHDGGTYGNRRLSVSTDAGRTWGSPITLQKHLQRLFAVPGRPATLLATGEPGYSGGDAPTLRSTDGGRTWTNQFADYTKMLAVVPDGETLDSLWAIAATKSYPTAYPIFRSRDGGATWTATGGNFDGMQLRYLTSTRGRLVAALLGSAPDSLRLSDDEGRTWREVTLPPPGYASGGAITQLAAEVDQPGVLHVLRESKFAGGNGNELWTSRDAGTTWQLATFVGGSAPAYGSATYLIAHAGLFALLSSWDGAPVWRATGNGTGAPPISRPTANTPTASLNQAWTSDENDRPKAEFRPGETLRLHLDVDTARAQPARLDYSVLDPAGNRVDALSMTDEVTLDPSLPDWVIDATIPRDQPPGRYTFRGTLTVAGQPASQSANFRIIR